MKRRSRFLRWRWLMFFGLGIFAVGLAIWVFFRIGQLEKQHELAAMVDHHGGHLDFADDFRPEIFGREVPVGWLTRKPDALMIFGSPSISDQEIELIAEFSSLTQVRLPIYAVTDEHLKILSRCENLRVLDVTGSGVTNDGISHLTRLTKLQILAIADTAVTDDGIDTILKIENLEYCSGTCFSPAGIDRLQKGGLKWHPSLNAASVSRP